MACKLCVHTLNNILVRICYVIDNVRVKLKAMISHCEGSCEKHNFTPMVKSYKFYETRRRLIFINFI